MHKIVCQTISRLRTGLLLTEEPLLVSTSNLGDLSLPWTYGVFIRELILILAHHMLLPPIPGLVECFDHASLILVHLIISLCVQKLFSVNFLLDQMFLEEFGHRNSLSGSSIIGYVPISFWWDESIVNDSVCWFEQASFLFLISLSLWSLAWSWRLNAESLGLWRLYLRSVQGHVITYTCGICKCLDTR